MKLRKIVSITLENLNNVAESMDEPYPLALAEAITTWSKNACLYWDGEIVGGGFEIVDEYNTELCIDIDCNVSDDIYKSYEKLLKIASLVSDKQLGFINPVQAFEMISNIEPTFTFLKVGSLDEMFSRYRKRNLYWRWKNSEMPSL